jgi:hypothetical protein
VTISKQQVEERWEVFMKRFELMGEINPKFVEETKAYLDALQVCVG